LKERAEGRSAENFRIATPARLEETTMRAEFKPEFPVGPTEPSEEELREDPIARVINQQSTELEKHKDRIRRLIAEKNELIVALVEQTQENKLLKQRFCRIA
jgi:hypothetical protein